MEYKVLLVPSYALQEDIKVRTAAGYELITMSQINDMYTVVYKKLKKIILDSEGEFYAN